MKSIDEVSGDAILSIIESDHYLYMGTHQGLLQYNPDGEEGNQWIVFTVNDGILNNAFNANAALLRKDGQLCFGTSSGFLSFHPGDIEIEKEKERLVFSDIQLFHHSIDYLPEKTRDRISPDAHPCYSKKIVLSHKDYHFGIEFATLSYKDPGKNRYAYMLDGFDKDWHYVNAQNRSVYYTNMKSGTYYFRVKGTNENSYMNSEEEVLEIVVLPPPYLSKWAYGSYFLLCILLIYLIVRAVRYRSKVKMQAFEHAKNEELAQEKIKFFTNISHELLTPLTVINCSVEELQRKENSNEKDWKAIKGNIFRLNRLLEQILEFRKAEKGKLQLSVAYGDIARFITGLCDNYFSQYSVNKQIEFICQTNPESIPGWFDKNAIDMIVYNLVSNAFKYNREDGKVVVNVTAEEIINDYTYAYVRITVGNTGYGFTQNQLQDLFKRFQSFRYTGREKPGNGIGLYLTKSLTALHKGEILVRSTPNVWTEFTIRIPIDRTFYAHELEEEADRQTQEMIYIPPPPMEQETEERNISREHDFTLLIIEDDQELRTSLCNLFKTHYHVLSASRGDDGYHMAQESNPDLILSDVMLPGINGFDLCKRLKNELETSHIPVILLTAKVTTDDQQEGYQTGADAYVTKPFHFELLRTQMESILLNRRRIAARFRETKKSDEVILSLPKMDRLFLEKAFAVIERRLSDEAFGPEQLQTEMNLTKSTLYRKLKAVTGLSPNEFIRNIRLKKACQLLETGEMNISEIAYRVGFSDPKYFTYCFKKEFHKTPTEYQAGFI